MSPPTFHISFPDEEAADLEAFGGKKNKSKVLRKAFELLRTIEHPLPAKQAALRTVLDRYFDIPKTIPHLAFYSFLHLLSVNYPDSDSGEFWGAPAYLSDHKRTHREMKDQIDDELKRLLSARLAGVIKKGKPNGFSSRRRKGAL